MPVAPRDGQVLRVSVVARRYGIQPQTLRLYEAGLLDETRETLSRGPGGRLSSALPPLAGPS